MAGRMSWALARTAAGLWRFNGLRIAAKLRAATRRSLIVSRPFAGKRLYLDVARTDTQGLLYFEGLRFVGERFLLADLVKPGMTVVDVGANIGYYSLYFAGLVGSKGKVVAIEPSPENLPELRLNISANQLSNVRLFESAVGAERGEVAFAAGINGGILGDDASGTYRVPVAPLDELIEDGVDFLKIDVEGFEGAVVEGARRLLSQFRPVVFLEFHPHLVDDARSTHERILSLLGPLYSKIEYYAVAQPHDLREKIRERYFGENLCRRMQFNSLDDAPVDARYGTFWIVCRNRHDNQ